MQCENTVIAPCYQFAVPLGSAIMALPRLTLPHTSTRKRFLVICRRPQDPIRVSYAHEEESFGNLCSRFAADAADAADDKHFSW